MTDKMACCTVPTKHGQRLPIDTPTRDSLSTLDVVWANKYEDDNNNSQSAKEKEAEFLRGAPPQWLNFYWAEKERRPFVKRDMYKEIQSEIGRKKNGSGSIYNINLYHEPGSGGSTLAMQVLWDRRKELRCAKLLDSTTDTKTAARQVLNLFNACGPANQNTVLLLLDNVWTGEDQSFKTSFENSLIDEIKATNIIATVPVVIILNCVRQKWLREKDKVILRSSLQLKSSLSTEEENAFKEMQNNVIQTHGPRHSKQFYAFNIMQGNYNPSYVKEICENLKPLKRKKRSRKEQLLAFLALLNSYIPGSYLSYDLCQQFLIKRDNNLNSFSFKQKMQRFTNFLVIFSTKEGENKTESCCVRLVHPMIADNCLLLLSKAGVVRSDTTRKLLTDVCQDTFPPYLVKTIKTLLTKRETRIEKQDDSSSKIIKDNFSQLIQDIKKHENPLMCVSVLLTKRETRIEKQDDFSQLIQDIQKHENPHESNRMCVSVLKMASKKFVRDPFLPQALARFYYLKMADYRKAEIWAQNAIKRDEANSFIRDTLGQVHKHHLKKIAEDKKCPARPRQILQMGKKATEAFNDEAETAMKEQGPEMQGHGLISTSTHFNNRGLFGYMQVANTIFRHLTKHNIKWSKVLQNEISPQMFFNANGGEKCGKYIDLLASLKDEVEHKFMFFEEYLTYSKPNILKDEPHYIRTETEKCNLKYVTQNGQLKTPCQILKEKMISTFAGLLNRASRDNEDIELITEQLEEIYLHSNSDADAVQNYIVANIIMSQRNPTSTVLKPLEELQSMLKELWENQKENRSPEFYLLVLLLFWPDGEQFIMNSPDITECVNYMRQSFEKIYGNFLRSRFLVPLFLLKEGKGLQRLVCTTQPEKNWIEILTTGDEQAEIQCLKGEVKNHKVFALRGPKQIEVPPHNPASVRGDGLVSFHLGFNIKGPVAYNITYELYKRVSK